MFKDWTKYSKIEQICLKIGQSFFLNKSGLLTYEGEVEDTSAVYEYVGTCFLIFAVLCTCCLGLTRTPLCSICAVFATPKIRGWCGGVCQWVWVSAAMCCRLNPFSPAAYCPPPLLPLCPPRGVLGWPGRCFSRRRVLSPHAECVSMLGEYCKLSYNLYTNTCKLIRDLIKLVMI